MHTDIVSTHKYNIPISALKLSYPGCPGLCSTLATHIVCNRGLLACGVPWWSEHGHPEPFEPLAQAAVSVRVCMWDSQLYSSSIWGHGGTGEDGEHLWMADGVVVGWLIIIKHAILDVSWWQLIMISKRQSECECSYLCLVWMKPFCCLPVW